ncbi:organic cation transporter protein-like [Mizuhopecten yessoensis]|uniref:organic cation transporter protein-like n=1 Tax=Mizuhopecten yessoensis TaxID=6573 RepID=UPI000B45C5E6|nr:organic cation transporter protein-like [Mizuhopecten yessoensis]
MDGPLDVDEIWKSLGTWGRYQRGQLLLCCVVAVIPGAFHLLSIVFIAYRPPFECRETTPRDVFPYQDDNDSSTYIFVYHQCSIDVFNNGSNSTLVTSTDCVSGYKYDFRHDASIVTEWNLFCDGGKASELAQTIVILGQGIGSAIFCSLADLYGRKPVHIICHVVLFCVALGIAWAPNPAVFIGLRFIIGTMQAGTGLTVNVAALESLPVNSRYLWNIADSVCFTAGCILVALVAYVFRDLPWRYMQIAFAVGSAYSLFEYWFLEESLRWLLANGKKERAEKIIRMAARMNGKDFDSVIKAASTKANEMEAFLAKPASIPPEENSLTAEMDIINNSNDDKIIHNDRKPEKYNALTIFKHKRILFNSLIIWYTWTINSLVYYALFLGSTSMSGDRYINYSLMALVEYPATAAHWYSVKRFGRRKSCIIFHTIAGVSLAVSTVCRTYQDDVTALGTVSLVFNFIGKFGITASFNTIYLYTPELYPTNLRSVGLGLASTSSRMGGMLAPFAGSVAFVIIWLPGAVFSVMCLIAVYLTSLLPETSGHELPTSIAELKLWYKANTGNRQKTKKVTAS